MTEVAIATAWFENKWRVRRKI